MAVIDYDKFPSPHVLSAVMRYIEEGIPPGDFLKAVICNKLKESFMWADETNIANMFGIVSWMYNHAPLQCWGSEEKMRAWLESGGLKGQEEAESRETEKRFA